MSTLPKPQKVIAFLLISLGIIVMLGYGLRALRSYRQWRYIQNEGFDRRIANVDAIQPWMTVRYVSVAYSVPEEYLFAQLDIPYDKRNSQDTLGRLNRVYNSGKSRFKGATILEETAMAIIAYQENPVLTDSQDIRLWMSIGYIANRSGVPESYLFTQIGITPTNNATRPLDNLAI